MTFCNISVTNMNFVTFRTQKSIIYNQNKASKYVIIRQSM